MGAAVIPPEVLIDPEGEGIYLLDDDRYRDVGNLLLVAAKHLDLRDDRGRLDWRAVDTELVWMRPAPDGETWEPAPIGKHPRGWRLNLPRRWRPAAYAYCTPKPEAAHA